MDNLFRNVWETFSSWSSPATPGYGSVSNQLTDRLQEQISYYLQKSSTGEFDRIPLDIIFHILKLLGPAEAAKLSAICKAWKFVAADNRLWIYFLQNHQKEPWDSVSFAETYLRSGCPIQTFPAQMADLSFMEIYAQRAQVPGAVIVDGGSGYCKFGYSTFAAPSGKSSCFLEIGNIESPLYSTMYSRLRQFFSAIFSRMKVKAYTQPIVVSVPICYTDDTESDKAARIQLVKAIYSALFDLQVPAVCAINQAVLALFAARQTSGIVVNIGFNQTSVVPILKGKVMHKVGVEVIGFGALKLTVSLCTVRALKENLCYVSLDYDAELLKGTEASHQVAGSGWFTLSKERFETGEVLFQPRMAGVRAMSLHQAVALCMEHCHDAELSGDDSWFKTVVLAGGSACLPGLAGRLDKELRKTLPQFISSEIKVIPPPHGADTAWYGAKLISNVSTFPGSWCVTKKQSCLKSRSRW